MFQTEVTTKPFVRKVTIEDKPGVTDLIIEFYLESLKKYGITIDIETIRETIQSFIDNHIGLVAEKEGKIIGVVGGLVSPSIFNKHQKIAQEYIWYVTKEERKGTIGIRLLKEFEKECVARGASLISMICMNNLYTDLLKKYYTIHGFELMEFHYMKGV